MPAVSHGATYNSSCATLLYFARLILPQLWKGKSIGLCSNTLLQEDSHSSLELFRTLQPEYVYAQSLSEVN